MTNITFTWIKGQAPGFNKAALVRRAVFCDEQGFSEENEFDEIDKTALHLVGEIDGAPYCTARLFFSEPGSEAIHLGRVAVLPALRGKGVGAQMLAQMLPKAKELGASAIVLDAQWDKQAFYKRAGYRATGNTSIDEGMPHNEMILVL